MLVLAVGLVLFLGMHSVSILMPSLRATVIERGGSLGAWKWPYVFVSVVGMVLIVLGYAQARAHPIMLYSPLAGWRYLALALMVPVFTLLVAAYMPGQIRSTVRHPMLIATVLWGSSHLLVTGSLAAVALFGGFVLWALADIISTNRRAKMRNVLVPLQTSKRHDILAIMAGLALYALTVLELHYYLFGVNPI